MGLATSGRVMTRRYVIERDDENETECDNPHPVRLSRNAQPYNNDEGSDRTLAIQAGHKGYLCPGSQLHFYSTWVVVDTLTKEQCATHDHYKPAKAHCDELNRQCPGPEAQS